VSALRTSLVVAVAAFALGLGLGRALPRPAAPPPSPAAPAAGAVASARRVRMPAQLRERAGVRAAALHRRPLSPAIDLVGAVEFDGDRVAEVGSRIAGRVARVLVRTGSVVRAGDPLVEVESTAVGEVVAAFISARAGAAADQAEAARLATLSRQQLATAREVEQNRAALAAHQAEMQHASQQLMAMGFGPADVRALSAGARLHRVVLRAPIAGKVVERAVVLGQVVEASATILRVADPSRLWVQLHVFDRDLARVRVGDAVEVASEAYPDRTFRGAVEHVAASLDPETRTARVRVGVDNTGEALRPGQFVTARLRPGAGEARPALMLPAAAIVQVEGRPAAFVAVGADEFELRHLELGAADGAEVEVRRGVDEGESAVVAGAFALKSELQR
jgi:cobalt-zinc-cadmium efflux system membrane fusion protein